MPKSRFIRMGVGVVTAVLSVAGTGLPAATATTPGQFDYTKVTGLSADVYHSSTKTTYMLPMDDGVKVYIEVTRPVTSKRVPVIAEISPYHGTEYVRDGWRMLPQQGGLVKYFVPKGYAVVMMDVRGTGRSGGCLDLMGPHDQADAKRVIEWAASRSWSSGRVGVIGHSYPGGTSVMSLAEHPKGLATAVVSAGLGGMYEHQFQNGVPYNAQWLGPIDGYQEFTIERHLPFGIPATLFGSGNGGDDLGNNTEYAACGYDSAPPVQGATQLTPLDQLSGRYAPWHAARDFRAGASTEDVPVFTINGVNDQAARISSLDWFYRRHHHPGDKTWIGQWDHGVGCCPNRRGYQWTQALHAWFDKQLQLRNVSTGPSVEVFLADGGEANAINGARSEVFTPSSWPPAARELTLYTGASGSLSSTKGPAGAPSFSGDPFGYFDNSVTDGVTFRTGAVGSDVLLAGVPRMTMTASVTVPRVYLISTLFDESPDGSYRRLSQFAINPELRNGLKTASVVIPAQKYVMKLTGFAMAHHLRKGHRLVMRVTTSDPDKLPFFSIDPHVTVFTGAGGTTLTVPIADGPIYKDSVKLTP